jgi:hypothetical protein
MTQSIITDKMAPDATVFHGNALMWVAHYRDNRIVNQYDDKGHHRSFADLPRVNLKRISMVSIQTGKMLTSQDFIQGMSPFYRQRNLITQGVGQSGKVHILGWAIWDGKKTVTNLHVAFINEATMQVEMGHFVEGRNVGFKYPIKIEEYDYPPIVWE